MWLPLMQREDLEMGPFRGFKLWADGDSGNTLIWETSSLKALLWVSFGEGRTSLPGKEAQKERRRKEWMDG